MADNTADERDEQIESWRVMCMQYMALEKMPRFRAALWDAPDALTEEERQDLDMAIVELRHRQLTLEERGDGTPLQGSPADQSGVVVGDLCDKVCLLPRVNIAHLTGIDAIVNAANSFLTNGKGVCGAIHSAAGPELEVACNAIGHCDIGDVVLTRGFNLCAKYILHAVGPSANDPQHENLLRSCYTRCLDLCKSHGIRSVAFCCLSTGVYRYPCVEAALVALETVRSWLLVTDNWHALERVVFVVRRAKDEEVYSKLMAELFPTTSSENI